MASSFAREKFLWLDQVRRDPELTPLAFMLAYVLAELVNEREGCAWPGIAHLAAECRVTGKGVKKVIRSLVERGYLRVEVGAGRGRIVGLSSSKPRAASAARATPTMIATCPRQFEEMHPRYRYPAEKGHWGSPFRRRKGEL